MLHTDSATTADAVALTVHGPAGALDVTVPAGTTLLALARTYAEQARLPLVLPLTTPAGRPLAPDATVAGTGLATGALLVAVEPAPPGEGPGADRRADRLEPGGVSALWCAIAAAVALLAGAVATSLPEDDRTVPATVLAVAALLGCLPAGPLRGQRVVVAPAFAAAAALALAWDPAPERLPMVLGLAALAGAVVAAVGRALTDGSAEALAVWVVSGVGWFVVAALGTLAGVDPPVVWTALFLLAVLAARAVPFLAVDLPDELLIDVERLAVSAWSARETPRGRRRRFVVPPGDVAAVAARGGRTVDAASVAVLVVAVVSAALLLATADLPMDRIGARCLVAFGGATLLFAGRSHRHPTARRLLQVAGTGCLALVVIVLGGVLGGNGLAVATGVLVVLAGLLLVVAVVVGRGWRSVWWARRAEVAEAVCAAAAVGSVVVATGLFRLLWEMTS